MSANKGSEGPGCLQRLSEAIADDNVNDVTKLLEDILEMMETDANSMQNMVEYSEKHAVGTQHALSKSEQTDKPSVIVQSWHLTILVKQAMAYLYATATNQPFLEDFIVNKISEMLEIDESLYMGLLHADMIGTLLQVCLDSNYSLGGRRESAFLLLGFASQNSKVVRALAAVIEDSTSLCSIFQETVAAIFSQLHHYPLQEMLCEFIYRLCRVWKRFPTQIERALRKFPSGFLDQLKGLKGSDFEQGLRHILNNYNIELNRYLKSFKLKEVYQVIDWEKSSHPEKSVGKVEWLDAGKDCMSFYTDLDDGTPPVVIDIPYSSIGKVEFLHRGLSLRLQVDYQKTGGLDSVLPKQPPASRMAILRLFFESSPSEFEAVISTVLGFLQFLPDKDGERTEPNANNGNKADISDTKILLPGERVETSCADNDPDTTSKEFTKVSGATTKDQVKVIADINSLKKEAQALSTALPNKKENARCSSNNDKNLKALKNEKDKAKPIAPNSNQKKKEGSEKAIKTTNKGERERKNGQKEGGKRASKRIQQSNKKQQQQQQTQNNDTVQKNRGYDTDDNDNKENMAPVVGTNQNEGRGKEVNRLSSSQHGGLKKAGSKRNNNSIKQQQQQQPKRKNNNSKKPHVAQQRPQVDDLSFGDAVIGQRLVASPIMKKAFRAMPSPDKAVPTKKRRQYSFPPKAYNKNLKKKTPMAVNAAKASSNTHYDFDDEEEENNINSPEEVERVVLDSLQDSFQKTSPQVGVKKRKNAEDSRPSHHPSADGNEIEILGKKNSCAKSKRKLVASSNACSAGTRDDTPSSPEDNHTNNKKNQQQLQREGNLHATGVDTITSSLSGISSSEKRRFSNTNVPGTRIHQQPEGSLSSSQLSDLPESRSDQESQMEEEEQDNVVLEGDEEEELGPSEDGDTELNLEVSENVSSSQESFQFDEDNEEENDDPLSRSSSKKPRRHRHSLPASFPDMESSDDLGLLMKQLMNMSHEREVKTKKRKAEAIIDQGKDQVSDFLAQWSKRTRTAWDGQVAKLLEFSEGILQETDESIQSMCKEYESYIELQQEILNKITDQSAEYHEIAEQLDKQLLVWKEADSAAEGKLKKAKDLSLQNFRRKDLYLNEPTTTAKLKNRHTSQNNLHRQGRPIPVC